MRKWSGLSLVRLERERDKEQRRLIVIEKLTKKHIIVLTVALFDALNSAKNIKYLL